jgi:hypothetical protein
MAARKNIAGAFTLVELMVTILAAMALIVGISAMLYHGHMGYHRLFKRVNSQVVRNAYEARRTFDRIVRKSSIRRCDLLNGNNEAYVYYFSNPQDMTIDDPDRYARFYLTGTELRLDQGPVPPDTFETLTPSSLSPETTSVLAHDVTAPGVGIFSLRGASVRMLLILDNNDPAVNEIETSKMTVTTTAIRHNW